jgi:hypothetical protein
MIVKCPCCQESILTCPQDDGEPVFCPKCKSQFSRPEPEYKKTETVQLSKSDRKAVCPNCGFTYDYTDEYAELAKQGTIPRKKCEHCGNSFRFQEISVSGPFYCTCPYCNEIYQMDKKHEDIICKCEKCDKEFIFRINNELTGIFQGYKTSTGILMIKMISYLMDNNLVIPVKIYKFNEKHILELQKIKEQTKYYEVLARQVENENKFKQEFDDEVNKQVTNNSLIAIISTTLLFFFFYLLFKVLD